MMPCMMANNGYRSIKSVLTNECFEYLIVVRRRCIHIIRYVQMFRIRLSMKNNRDRKITVIKYTYDIVFRVFVMIVVVRDFPEPCSNVSRRREQYTTIYIIHYTRIIMLGWTFKCYLFIHRPGLRESRG